MSLLIQQLSTEGGEYCPASAPREHSGICSPSCACAVYQRAISRRHLVLSCGPNMYLHCGLNVDTYAPGSLTILNEGQNIVGRTTPRTYAVSHNKLLSCEFACAFPFFIPSVVLFVFPMLAISSASPFNDAMAKRGKCRNLSPEILEAGLSADSVLEVCTAHSTLSFCPEKVSVLTEAVVW
ncbi:hypothetical protein ATANTOWER_030623 [Ataeniobius toweri]|uniref:FHA domain-containing protein n=1 Tax=Ataeniobius toweri TaxID=208326 RepID=A0ABU7B3D4_9TELE|nr:hypothetical protein [Ataeniobius toweri]